MKVKIISALILLASGCAGDFLSQQTTGNSGDLERQREIARTAQGAYIRFHHSDFFSLGEPNEFSCAGSIHRYYTLRDTSSTEHVAFETSVEDPTRTIKPNFINTVVVDLTDANANVPSNNAFSCSYGNGSGVPPTSNCATFDYGAIGGIPTTLSGSLLFVGGILDKNHTLLPNGQSPTVSCGPLIPEENLVGKIGEDDLNVCSPDMYALGPEILPASAATNPPNSLVPGLSASTEPISSWSKISGSSSYVGPTGATGSSIVYNANQGKILLFGGNSAIDPLDILSPGIETNDTWIFSMDTQTWTKMSPTVNIPLVVGSQPDCTDQAPFPAKCEVKRTKAAAGRSVFGYTAVPGLALSAMGNTDAMVAGNLDTTDRIVTAGGLGGLDGQGNTITFEDVLRFNPTFGPDWVDNYDGTTTTLYETQWMDSYHTQLLVNFQNENLLHPTSFTGTFYNLANFGAAFAVNDGGGIGVGYLLTAGGFHTNPGQVYNTVNQPATHPGNFQYTARRGMVAQETDVREFVAHPTHPFDSYWDGLAPEKGSETQNLPIDWTTITPAMAAPNDVPNYGGVNLHRGFEITANSNEYIYWGGVNCRSYFIDSGAFCNGTTEPVRFNTDGRYYSLGNADPMPAMLAGSVAVTNSPTRAGGASTEAIDPAGNKIIVTWGGVGPAIGHAVSNEVCYLYNNGGTPTWTCVVPTFPRPAPATNAAMVYSHVTGKIYLFGGYETEGTPQNSGDTWELTISGAGACTTSGSCTFTWEQMNTGDGVTCHPNCTDGPSARRSHRMVEVNYNNTDPTTEPTCATNSPCSYGIFLEGGTADGVNVFGDRWVFDPTANGGRGHWAKVNDFPQRKLASLATIDYFIPSINKTVSKGILFGGEMSNHSTDQVLSGKYYVPPTLGDTMMFDFDSNQWTRVQLLGKGIADYAGAIGLNPQAEELRQMYNVNDPGPDPNRTLLKELSPPPISGAVAVTRIFSGPLMGASTPVEPLKIPEVFLFGGRLKDGTFNTLDKVYKFCSGTTGEDPINDDATCDAFDSSTNPVSPNPTDEPKGRWLRKQPFNVTFDPAGVASYNAAGTYDSFRDRIILVGGAQPDSASAATHITQSWEATGLDATSEFPVLEYTPPSISLTPNTLDDASLSAAERQGIHGVWTKVYPCSTSSVPAARFGHSLAYDSLNDQLILVGGQGLDGTPLTQVYYQNGSATSSVIPEVWKGKRDDQSTCYEWTQLTTFGNILSAGDMPTTALSQAASIFINSSGYNTGYYMTFDESCVDSGPIASNDPEISKLLAGGADIFINRDSNSLCENEDLLLHLIFMPMGPENQRPDNKQYTQSESAQFKIHLKSTGLQLLEVEGMLQPHYLTLTDPLRFPKTVDTISVVSPPTGRVVEKQIYLPVSTSQAIDNIRIERVSGSAVLFGAKIMRMGCR